VDRPRTFIVLDHNSEGSALLARTLLRKFPLSEILECAEADEAVTKSRDRVVDAIVVHRPIGMSGEDAIRILRKENPKIPLVMVSSVDRGNSALAAGASSFLHYDAWLMLGSVVEDLVKEPSDCAPWPAS
jgi:DNA-binding NarL/FixJ family response regulator